MKTKTTYICEICNDTWNNEQDARTCEARGVETPLPVGFVFNETGRGKMYKDITFCVAKSYTEGHQVHYSLWACRDNGYGDSLGRDLCGGNDYDFTTCGKPNKKHPTFKRLVSWLRKKRKSIKIKVWDGKKIVDLK